MAGLDADIRVFEDPEALSRAAAVIFDDTAIEAVLHRGRFLVCLSGGRSPIRLYEILAQSPHRDLIDWAQTHAFWGDERGVPAEDLNSNYKQARDVLLSRVPVPPENIHRIRTELDPDAAAADYALVLRKYAEAPLNWPRFDLVLLGLGADGHTASIFPGTAIDSRSAALAVTSADPKRPGWRVTLTPEVFNSARTIVFLAQGAGKSRIAASVLYGEHLPEQLPAQRIRPTDGELIWLLDREAATSP